MLGLFVLDILSEEKRGRAFNIVFGVGRVVADFRGNLFRALPGVATMWLIVVGPLLLNNLLQAGGRSVHPEVVDLGNDCPVALTLQCPTVLGQDAEQSATPHSHIPV